MQRGRWIIESDLSNIGYLKAENANGRHILIQPADASCYLLADDLSWSVISRHHRHADGEWKPGRMVVETSPQNYQVWIRSRRALCLLEKRIWLKRLLSDPGADPNNRWGRCPGFRNRKDKYRKANGHYPLSRLIWVDWAREAHIPPLSAPAPLSPQPQRGGVCHPSEVSRSDYERDNQSATDFSYALALMRRGYNDEQIRDRILSERTCWHNHQGQTRMACYVNRTIRQARALLESV